MRIINKSGKEKVIKLGSKFIHFMDGQVKEGFPPDFLAKHKDYAKDFEKIKEDEKDESKTKRGHRKN